ncbi:MAG: NHLP family bacteriocin export ABC transporter peptidase/permease/ATPase subunit [Oscillospiraceae bacterium]|nr:NHLP family bacteriocin export ABC transporter peptidase/permease/ATPase subunit [Oscillospiraceae bacterium]
MSNTNIKSPLTKGIAKVPVIMQMEALECGAACLAMISAYYEKWIPLEQVRIDCGVSRDGSNAKNILVAARSYGLTAKGYRYDIDDLKEKGKFPCIIHWNFNHFVVLNGFKNNKAVLNDPAKGTYSVSMEVFDDAYTGICLMFEPSDNFVPEGKPKSVLKFALARMKGAESAIVFSIVCAVIASLMGIILPGFSRIFLDRLLTHQNPEWFYPFLTALSVISALSIIVTGVQAIFSNKINGKLSVVGNMSFLWKIMHMPMVFFTQRMAGDIQDRQNTNANIANQFVNIFAPIALDAAMMIFYLVVMIRYSPLLASIGIISIVINIFISHIISKIRVNISRVQMRDAGKLAGATIAGIEMVETIKSSGAENGFFAKWAGYQASVNKQKVKSATLEQYVGQLPALVSVLTNTAVMMLGVYFAMEGSFTVGMIMAFQGFLSSFYAPASKIITAGQSITEMRTSMERIEDVMNYPSDVCYESENLLSEDDDFEKLKGNIELRNVSFGYSPLEKPLIENFNLSVKTGGKVAIVGGSGCGKSTIAKLISGLYLPASGEILFDGKSIREIDRSVFTGSLAVVDQDIILFEDTIANNIKMWDNSIEDFEMILAAHDAQLHEDIMQRDGGYRYKLSEGGKEFSGGQRQRLEIARALAQDPTIIILDEATSALDAKTEFEVVKAIENRGITCIVIAHRLSTIRDCDEIIVLDKGKIVERGTHDELYAKGGKYTELVSND